MSIRKKVCEVDFGENLLACDNSFIQNGGIKELEIQCLIDASTLMNTLMKVSIVKTNLFLKIMNSSAVTLVVPRELPYELVFHVTF